MLKTIGYFSILYLSLQTPLLAQKSEVNLSLYDGIIVAGYVDNGAFLNFLGPNINLTKGNSKWILGMLPSLRFKEDTKTPKNAFVTPNLGMGLTYQYNYLAVQVPMYYNPKTATSNGKWCVGVGIGFKLNVFNKKN